MKTPEFSVSGNIESQCGFLFRQAVLPEHLQQLSLAVGRVALRNSFLIGTAFLASALGELYLLSAKHCFQTGDKDDSPLEERRIIFPGGAKIVVSPAQAVALPDAWKRVDLLVAHLDHDLGIKPLTLACIENPADYQSSTVMALGYPGSYLARLHKFAPVVSVGQVHYWSGAPYAIVTDVRIEPGYSGSPLLNTEGQVIGVVYGGHEKLVSPKTGKKTNSLQFWREGRKSLSAPIPGI